MLGPAVVWLTVVFEGMLALVALGVGALAGQSPFSQLSLSLRDGLLGLAATLPLLVFLHWSLVTRQPALARLRERVVELIVPLFHGCSALHLLVIALAAGIGEELLFRGVLQPVAERLLPTLAALVVVSLLFGLCHAITPTYALIATIIGAYLGALLLFTGNLLVPIVVHALYDLVALRVLLQRAAPAASGASPAASDPPQ